MFDSLLVLKMIQKLSKDFLYYTICICIASFALYLSLKNLIPKAEVVSVPTISELKKFPKRIKIAPNETGITIRSKIHKNERLITLLWM